MTTIVSVPVRKPDNCYAMEMDVSQTAQLAARVRKARQEKGLSQEELAGGVYSAAYVSHVEHGKRNPSHEALTYFAGRLGMTYEQLVTGRDPLDDLRLEVEIQRGMTLIHDGKPDAARSLLEDVREEGERLSAARVVTRSQTGIALSLFREGRIDEALAGYEQLAAMFPDDAIEDRTAAMVGIARCLFHGGELREAVDVLESHLARLMRSPAPDPTALLQVYSALIGPYIDLGYMEKAKHVAIKGSEVAQESGDPEQLACLFINRAALLLEQSEPREALMFLARAEDTYKQLGWQVEAAKVNVARGMVFLDQDDFTRAKAAFEAVLDDARGTATTRDRARALTGLAQVHRRMGEPQRGLDVVAEALKLAGDQLPTEAAEAHREWGLCAQAGGDEDAALKSWESALDLYLQAGDKAESARTATLVGDALMKTGEAERAAAAYRRGLTAMDGLA